MNLFKKISFSLFLLLSFIFIVGWFYSNSLKPRYSGTLNLKGLENKVTVYFDDNGVPHIYAENEKDAYKALGYVHAQDRLFQMELIRRIAAGRLSEIFGKDLVETDKFMSGLGIEENAKETIKNIDKNSKPYVFAQSYIDGINVFIDEGKTPLEFSLVGIKKEHYTINDIYNVYGYMAFSFAAAHKVDPLLNEIKEKFGKAYLNELGIPISKSTLLKNQQNEPISGNFTAHIQKITKKIPVPMLIGSNSWVVNGKKTKRGKVILANDPHIGFSQPSVWYQNHIVTPDYEMYGYNLALNPFPLLGHNRSYANGLTMFQNDDIDFYIEENNPSNKNEYKTSYDYKKYKIRQKHLKIKGEKDSIYTIRVSKHGSLMNDLLKDFGDERPIAMQWIYTKLPNNLLKLSYEMSHANSFQDFKKCVSLLHAPGLNIMYGDAQGNIAWFASGKLYKYRKGVNTKTFLNGVSGEDEILEMLDFSQNPQAVNPDWNYVYSANNQPDSIAGMLYPGYYLPEDRAKRIEQLLNAKNDFTSKDMALMINDITSPIVADVISDIVKEIDVISLTPSAKNALQILKNWKGNYVKEAVAPVIYNRFLYEFLKNTFKDEFGSKFETFMSITPFQKKLIAVQTAKENSLFWDNVTTNDVKEDKKDIVTTSFKNTIQFLENQLGSNVDSWQWKRVATVEFEHPIGKAGGLLRKIFNVGPFTTSGGNEVLNNQIFKLDSTGYYKVLSGPSTRRIIDFSDVENSISILPTGQSGNVLSRFYKNQTQKYLNGGFVKMLMNKKEIEKSKHKLILLPDNN